ncbi:MAG: PAS domain S-box protein [Pseudomonadota bacterium]
MTQVLSSTTTDLADLLPHIVWTMEANGSCTWCNRAWADYCGLSQERGLKHSWLSQVHADDRARVVDYWASALPLGLPCEVEYRLRGADGTFRWMLARALPQRNEGGAVSSWVGSLTDIDHLKQAAGILEKSEAINRIAGRVARLGGWTIELPDLKLTWSDENCAIHDVPPGYQPTLDEGISYFLPEHRDIVKRHVALCAQEGTPYEFVLPKNTAKGRRIWVRSIGEALRDASGKIVRLQGAFQDITEQRMAQERMLALEMRLMTTLESITDGFYLVDREWKISFINGPAERMLRRARGELVGAVLWDVFALAAGSLIEQHYRLALERQQTAHFEFHDEALGSWFDVKAYPTQAGLAVYFQDVTQRRSEQAQLLLLETAVARLNDMVVIIEAGVETALHPRIVFVNDAFERTTGYGREDAIGNSPEFLWGPRTSSEELDRILAAMKAWQPARAEIVIYTKAGEALWLEIDIAPIADSKGALTHWVAVERDITERRRQQAEIQSLNSELETRVEVRTAQLASLNQELEAFAYSVSHDLRAPLSTIHGFSQLLAKADGPEAGEKRQHYLARILAGAAQMGELIEGLLTLAALSRELPRLEKVDMSAIARRLADDLQEREPGRKAQIVIQPGMTAQGDPRLMLAVYQNLMANAWKFSSRQACTRIDIGCQAQATGDAVFFVKDNGVGFDMAFATKLFGTFQRLHSPQEFAGNGIGLATVRRVVERHGGRAWAEGKPGEGASFYFTVAALPKLQGLPAKAAPSSRSM